MRKLSAIVFIVTVAIGAAFVVLQPGHSSAFTADFNRRVVEVAPGESIQAAIDYAASQGAWQGITTGTTEQGGTPWLVMLLPGEYHESGIETRPGVNIGTYGERTVLLTSDQPEPVITCGSNSTISGITIEHTVAGQPAIHVVHGASQCSVHRSIIAGKGGNGEAVRVSGGFMRMFDTDIRAGKVVLEPVVQYPVTNPVAFNCVRCRMWHDDFIVKGSLNALYLFIDSNFGSDTDNIAILSTATGHVDGRVIGSNNLRRVQVTGTYKTLIRDSDIGVLTVAAGASAEIYGSFVGDTGFAPDATVIWHQSAPHIWLEQSIAELEE